MRVLLWITVISITIITNVEWVDAEKNFVEAWNDFVKRSERLFLGENDASEKVDLNVEEGEDKVKALRMQHIQNQILRKLRMKERPPVSTPKGTLPLPIRDGATMLPHQFTHPTELQSDEYYAKTEQKIIFPDDNDLGICRGSYTNHHSACLTFTMPEDLQPQDVNAAELWMYKEVDLFDSHNQTLVVSEAVHWDLNQQFRKTRPVAIHETNVSDGWIKVDVGWAAPSWIEANVAALEISCPSCGAPASHMPISLERPNRPFLVINTRYNAKKRKIRHLECAPGTMECCRERLYVSFAAIGWDDWILQPKGYHAHFCKGSCSSIAAVTLSGSAHQSVIKKLFHSNHPQRLELKSCCSPTTFSPLQLFYMDSNNTVTQKILPNMIVESCGCM